MKWSCSCPVVPLCHPALRFCVGKSSSFSVFRVHVSPFSQVIESVENVAEPTFEDLKALEDAVNGVRYYAPPYVYALKSNSGEAYLSLIELEAGYDGNADNEKSAAQYSATPTYFTLISESNRGYVLKVDNMDNYQEPNNPSSSNLWDQGW